MTPKPRAFPMSLDFALLRGAIEEIPFGVATIRGDDITYANAALERTFGAPAGGLEHKPLSTLFDAEQFAEVDRALREARAFDGRVHGKGIDGRSVDAEVHVERYMSQSAGTGGFLVARDIALELSALGRLVDLMGGALFRWRVEPLGAKTVKPKGKTGPRSSLEYVSPSIARIVGLEPEACVAHPELFLKFVATEERDRLGFLYRRLAHGDVPTITAQVSVVLSDGRSKLLALRATGRRDTGGMVRHIEGVVTEAISPLLAATQVPPSEESPSTSHPPKPKTDIPADGFVEALLEMGEHLLREADQHHQTLGREVRLLRGAMAADESELARETTARLDRITAAAGGAVGLTRRVRRAMRRATAHATVGDLVDNLRSTLAPCFGEAPLTATVSPDARDVLLKERVDELTLALLHVALRTFRLAGAGSLKIHALLVEGQRDLALELTAHGPMAEAHEGEPPPDAEVADLEDTIQAIVGSLGGTAQAELMGPGEIRVLLHLPR
jgi:PAS domain S-box-containing protein